jgi:hypothetical protein
MSSPPPGEGDPALLDVAQLAAEAAAAVSIELSGGGPAHIVAHEKRIREAMRLFFESAAKLFTEVNGTAGVDDGRRWVVTLEGKPVSDGFEPTKIFKFYYTGPDGNPDLSLAVARLIAETYGGEVNAVEDRDKVSLQLSFPLGAE